MNHTSSWNLEVIPVVMENHEITTTLNHHHHHHHHQVFPTHHPLLQTPNYNPSCNNQIMNIINKNLHQQLLADHDHIHQDQAELILTKDQEDQEQDQEEEEEEEEELGAMKEMMYRIAAMQPVVDIDPATIRKPKRRNVRISEDPQSVAARLRRERISEKMRILQRLVPGGRKMDTASMLDEAIRYVKFLKKQIRLLQSSNYDQPNPITPPIRISDGLVTNLTVASFSESVSTCNNVIKPYPFSLPSTTTTAAATSSIGLPGGFRFEFEENESDPAAPTMCFNHHEVISE